ncbi:hypothetical protein AMATHDRAFT_70120 [Amanita thiersii Skay4041]|uniref:Uncharacterized protein n=1 Tax=Amanita thiersii Skay4041 TaxID=703135 RepID=A0A2A9N7Y3_9AGAR|nr:hypothetical protein AMATHDRAFT_70120 [Amanita thiersii Skay4041]
MFNHGQLPVLQNRLFRSRQSAASMHLVNYDLRIEVRILMPELTERVFPSPD